MGIRVKASVLLAQVVLFASLGLLATVGAACSRLPLVDVPTRALGIVVVASLVSVAAMGASPGLLASGGGARHLRRPAPRDLSRTRLPAPRTARALGDGTHARGLRRSGPSTPRPALTEHTSRRSGGVRLRRGEPPAPVPLDVQCLPAGCLREASGATRSRGRSPMRVRPWTATSRHGSVGVRRCRCQRLCGLPSSPGASRSCPNAAVDDRGLHALPAGVRRPRRCRRPPRAPSGGARRVDLRGTGDPRHRRGQRGGQVLVGAIDRHAPPLRSAGRRACAAPICPPGPDVVVVGPPRVPRPAPGVPGLVPCGGGPRLCGLVAARPGSPLCGRGTRALPPPTSNRSAGMPVLPVGRNPPAGAARPGCDPLLHRCSCSTSPRSGSMSSTACQPSRGHTSDGAVEGRLVLVTTHVTEDSRAHGRPCRGAARAGGVGRAAVAARSTGGRQRRGTRNAPSRRRSARSASLPTTREGERPNPPERLRCGARYCGWSVIVLGSGS